MPKISSASGTIVNFRISKSAPGSGDIFAAPSNDYTKALLAATPGLRIDIIFYPRIW